MSDTTFTDLYTEAQNIKSMRVDRLMAGIYAKKIAKDPASILASYETKKDEAELEKKQYEEQAASTKELMDLYADKMKTSYENDQAEKDDDSSYYEIENDVDDANYWGRQASETTYDSLTEKYVDFLIKARKAQNEIDHCDMVIQVFSGEKALSDYTGVQEADMTEDEVIAELDETTDMIEDLYNRFEKTNDDYLKYLAAKEITISGTASAYKAVNVKQYGIIALAFCAGLVILTFAGFDYLNRIAKRGK